MYLSNKKADVSEVSQAENRSEPIAQPEKRSEPIAQAEKRSEPIAQAEKRSEPIAQAAPLSELKTPESSAAERSKRRPKQPDEVYLRAIRIYAPETWAEFKAKGSNTSKMPPLRDLDADVTNKLMALKLGDGATMVAGIAGAGALIATAVSLPTFSADSYLCLQAAALALANANPFQAFEKPRGTKRYVHSFLTEAYGYGLPAGFSAPFGAIFAIASVVQVVSALCADTTMGVAGNAVAAVSAAWAAGRFLLAERLKGQIRSEDTPAIKALATFAFRAKMAASLTALGVTTVVMTQQGLMGGLHAALAGTTVLCALANAACMGLNRLHYPR